MALSLCPFSQQCVGLLDWSLVAFGFGKFVCGYLFNNLSAFVNKHDLDIDKQNDKQNNMTFCLS